MPVIIAVVLAIVGGFFKPAAAHADVWCDIMSENPSISQAENMIAATAIAAQKQGADYRTVGRMLAEDIVNNCPQYSNIVLNAAQNIGG